MSRRCENCAHWSSTDKVWGSCDYASTRDDGDKLAHASYVRLGDEKQAELETKYKFGCVVWKTLRTPSLQPRVAAHCGCLAPSHFGH
ncbi:hypothetical protein PDO_5083 [Rhizobium sp. PDO1-076]|uniref:hypothetical protein n=1 Tax=Rhizobium sp. PDO1-076 TaxID=1125979 RepID=UPI00024E2D0C|nr:hypothetical protein [Rhizobium sp. PDO1-076]EHS51693.1 hypothetical protein PDO_5083 [Rhizobium sp. PDO1-076]